MQVSEGTSRRRSRGFGQVKSTVQYSSDRVEISHTVVNACAFGARICIAKCYTIKYGTVQYCTIGEGAGGAPIGRGSEELRMAQEHYLPWRPEW